MPVSSVTEHWIKPDAVTINLNHFGDPDYLQVSELAGAVVMAFKQDVISYNSAHNYRTWPLQAANTYLELTSTYNVYARLTRSEVNASALIVYDPILRDIEGRPISHSEKGEEVLGEADPTYFYVFLGQISSSIGSSGQSVSREWIVDFRFGNLDTSQYRNEEAGGEWQKMFRLNKVTDMIDVLKTFSSAVFKKIFIGEKGIVDIKRSVDSDESVPVSDSTIPTTKYVREANDDRYLRKDQDDRSVGTIASDKGFLVGNEGKGFSVGENGTVTAIIDQLLEIVGIQSKDFSMGEFGNGFLLKYDKDKKRSYMEIDELLVRKIAYFISLVIKELKHVGGTIVLSPASMKCSRMETYTTYYRCYFESEHDGVTVNQEFVAGDLARCQTFNVKEGVNSNVRNTYYWRYVVAVGDNYIDLSITDCDAGSGVPQKGDEIVQLGNRYDDSRQNAIILSTVGDDAPSFKQYQGINNYYLSDDNAVTIFSPSNNVIKGKFLSQSTGKDYDEELKKLQVDWDSVLEQTDKEFTMWFFEHEPTLDNEPAVDWDSEELKKLHDQDLFYDRKSGLAYRFEKVDGVWMWSIVTDADTIRALEKAAEADKKAEEAKKEIEEIVSDGILSVLEKKEVLKEWETIVSVYPTNISNADKYELSTSSYTSAYLALGSYLNGGNWNGNGTPSWLGDLANENTPIDAEEYRSVWVAYYNEESALIESISDAIKGIADNKKRVFVDTPYPPYDVGDMWVNAYYGTLYTNDNLVCVTSKAEGETFSIDDWQPTSDMNSATKKVFESSIERLDDRITLQVTAHDKLNATVTSLGIRMDGAEEQISIYANKTNTLEGTVTQLGIDLDAAEEKISIYATKVDALEGTVTQLGIDLDAAEGSIKAIAGRFDEDGHLIEGSGWVTTTEYNSLYSVVQDIDGSLSAKAEVRTSVQYDPDTGAVTSAIKLTADKISLEGATTINNSFSVDTDGTTRIAGFTVSDNGLINSGFNNDAYVIFRNDTYKTFAGIGGNIFPSEGGLRAVARFENHDTEDSWYMGTNYAMLVSAQGGRENVAIQLNGGSVACLALKTQIIGHDNIVQSTAPTSKSVTLSRDVGSLYVSTQFNWKSSSSATSYESKARDIYLTLPTMDVYDDGHTIKIKRGSNNNKKVYIYPGGSYRMDYNSSTGTYDRIDGETYIMYDGTSYATTSDELVIESEGDAMELVYHRDLKSTINNKTYYGCWIQHKHPRNW